MKNGFAVPQRTMRLLPVRASHIAAAALGLAAALASIHAQADVRSAAASLHANMVGSRANLGVNTAELVPGPPTLVRGMYALNSPQGETIGYTNESGTLFGDARGFYVISPKGARLRKLSSGEGTEVRIEVMNNIEYDKLMRISSGNGGGRKLLLFSAIDCPHCKSFEDILAKSLRETTSTVYVAPSSLQSLTDGGLKQWETVTRLWCAENSGRAWQTYWQTRAVPASRACRLTPQSAYGSSENLRSILMGIGAETKGLPALLREDGIAVERPPAFDSGWAAMLGPMGSLAGVDNRSRWLAAGMQPDDKAGAYSSQNQQGQPQPGQEPNKVKASDLLKKLFK